MLRAAKKNGLGGAYRAGFAWGLERGYDRFVEIDCDSRTTRTPCPACSTRRGDHDVVIGSRYVTGGHIPNWSIPRLC